MSNTNKKIAKQNANTQVAMGNDAKFDQTVEVLYQKMGDRWFAFSVIEDELFVGSITQEEVDQAEPKAGKA